MNSGQQSVLRGYAAVVVLMCLIVPWRQYKAQGGFTVNHGLGYGFVFKPPPYLSLVDVNLDTPRWAVSIIGATLAAGALTLSRATRRP